MSFKSKIILFTSLILIFVSISRVEHAREITIIEPTTKPNPFLADLSSSFNEYMNEKVGKINVPGAAVCIVKDNQIILLEGYGYKDINTHDSVGIHTVFRLGSVSKSLTSTLAGMLVEDKIISWDDPIQSILPEFNLQLESTTESLTVKHVLSHTTGLIRHAYTNLIEEGKSLDDMLLALSDVHLIGPVGMHYSYQNVAYSVIEKVMAESTGKSFEQLLDEQLFLQMNMKNSSASYEGIVSNIDHASPHYYSRGALRKSKVSKKYYNAAPAGGINSSISDMANLMMGLTGNKPWAIKSETLDSLYAPQIRTYIKYKYFSSWPKMKKAHYGMGFRVLEYDDKNVIYHGGYVNGYRSGIALIPEDNIGICILTNYPGNLAHTGIRDFLNMYLENSEMIDSWQEKSDLLVEDLQPTIKFPEELIYP